LKKRRTNVLRKEAKMGRERNWRKFRLCGARSIIDEVCRDEQHVNLLARQTLEAARSSIRAALLQWDTPFLTNGEKSWREIIMEISRNHEALWHYITALRGPDPADCSHTVKVIFTCPLRGRCAYALGREEFVGLSSEEIEKGFAAIREHRHKLYHYLQHITAVWEVFYPPLGELLGDVFLRGILPEPKEAAERYVKLLRKWMCGKHVIMKEATDD